MRSLEKNAFGKNNHFKQTASTHPPPCHVQNAHAQASFLDPLRPARLVGSNPRRHDFVDLLTVQINLGDHLAHLVIVQRKGLDCLVSTGPFVFTPDQATFQISPKGLPQSY